MLQDSPPQTEPSKTPEFTPPLPTFDKPQDSYVKLAMRNMVRKSGTSLRHFAFTTVGLLAALISLAYIFR